MTILLPLLKFLPVKWLPIIKWVAILAILAALLAPYIMLYLNFKELAAQNKTLVDQKAKLELDNVTLKSNNVTLKSSIEVLQFANRENQITIQKLLEERKDAKLALENLAQKSANDAASIEMMNSRIKELLRDPKNDGEVAPVLRETINNIQKMRKQ